jgi:hypothetical protein
MQVQKLTLLNFENLDKVNLEPRGSKLQNLRKKKKFYSNYAENHLKLMMNIAVFGHFKMYLT